MWLHHLVIISINLLLNWSVGISGCRSDRADKIHPYSVFVHQLPIHNNSVTRNFEVRQVGHPATDAIFVWTVPSEATHDGAKSSLSMMPD